MAGFKLGAALTSFGQSAPGIGEAFDKSRNASIERERQARLDEQDRKQKEAALLALAQEMKINDYGQKRKIQTDTETDTRKSAAQSAFGRYTTDIKAMKQAQETGGEYGMQEGGYAGPLNPEYKGKLAELGGKSAVERMGKYELPYHAAFEPGVKNVYDAEVEAQKKKDDIESAKVAREAAFANQKSLQDERLENQRLLSEETARHNREMERLSGEKNAGKDKSDMEGIDPETGKPYTAVQRSMAGYALRANESNTVAQKLFSSGFDAGKIENAVMKPDKLNLIKDPKQRQYAQAARNFINSILRPESGAVIAESEFKDAYRQYFAQPGDDPDTQEQKRQNRLQKIAGLKAAAGTGFDIAEREYEKLKESNPAPVSNETKVINGVTYKKVAGGWQRQ